MHLFLPTSNVCLICRSFRLLLMGVRLLEWCEKLFLTFLFRNTDVWIEFLKGCGSTSQQHRVYYVPFPDVLVRGRFCERLFQICSVGATLFHVGQMNMTKLIIVFRNFENTRNNYSNHYPLQLSHVWGGKTVHARHWLLLRRVCKIAKSVD
jgi:hypothetical protein